MIKHLQPGKLYRTTAFLDVYEKNGVSMGLSPDIILMFVERVLCSGGAGQQQGYTFDDFKFLLGESMVILCTAKLGQAYMMANLEGPLV